MILSYILSSAMKVKEIYLVIKLDLNISLGLLSL